MNISTLHPLRASVPRCLGGGLKKMNKYYRKEAISGGFRRYGITSPNVNVRPLQNLPFCPISTSGSNFNPRNTQCIHVVKTFIFLKLEQK
jgi:hypothetical protein